MKMEAMVIVLPEYSMDRLSEGLRELTRVCSEAGADISGGFLGGEFGYGAYFENDEFMMHPYCWCEKDECEWCCGDAPNFLHKPSGLSVTWYKYIGRGMIVQGPADLDVAAIIRACIESIRAA